MAEECIKLALKEKSADDNELQKCNEILLKLINSFDVNNSFGSAFYYHSKACYSNEML